MNNNVKVIISIYFLCIFLVLLSSCNQGRIEELVYEVSKLENENRTLKRQIEEYENTISIYESRFSQISDQQNQNRWHQDRAAEHMRSAEFWRQSGNDFLYESNMRAAQQEIDMIP